MGAPQEKPHPLIDAINKVSQIKGVTVGHKGFKIEIGKYDTKVPSRELHTSRRIDNARFTPTFEKQNTFGINISKEL